MDDDTWFDVTPRSSAFEVHLSTNGHYRHRPKLRPHGPEPAEIERRWREGRPPESRVPVRASTREMRA